MTSSIDTTHYFDWAATSPADAQIQRNALETALSVFANPSSVHAPGISARETLENARKKCASTLGVSSKQLFFTSGGTESDHIPLLSLLTRPAKGSILISGIEHPALREQAAALRQCGWNINTLMPDENGFIPPEQVAAKLTADTMYVTVMEVNNETGCIQDVYKIADVITAASAGKRRPKFHVDCVQAAGKIPINLAYPGIDSAAFSAHKICGPRGIGLLYLAQPIEPFLRGGGQENGIRSGTENLFGAIAFSDCLERYLISDQNPAAKKRFSEQQEWTGHFITQLTSISTCRIIPAVRTDPDFTGRFSPWIVQASFKNIPGEVMVRALSAKGFYISTGSACSAKKQSRPILAAMNLPAAIQSTAVRFSFGPSTTKESLNELFNAVFEICKSFGA